MQLNAFFDWGHELDVDDIPIAQAHASLLQHFGPEFQMQHLKAANESLEQLKHHYTPTVIKHGFSWHSLKLLVVSDSSLGNASEKYSQGAYWVMLATDNQKNLCGSFVLLTHNSARSKRVASSTFSAETLAAMLGTEEALVLQTWLHEIQHPTLTARQLTQVIGSDLIPIDLATDCKDLYEVLVKPAFPSVTNKSLGLYVAALRQQKESQRLRHIFWIDTTDMVVNAFTKYEAAGLLPLDHPNIKHILSRCRWEPLKQFEMTGVGILPHAFKKKALAGGYMEIDVLG